MVSVIVLRTTGKRTEMLIARRHDEYLNGVWSYIAGHIAQGEAGWQAARRELREETGLVPDEFYATSFCEQFYLAESNSIEIVPAFVARVDAAASVQLNAEHSAFRWVSLDEAAALLPFGSQRDLLAYVQREFIARAPAVFLRIPSD
ncbi:MAG: NUDIX hydrolase [Gammaproteobacteria bacterium]